MLDFYNLISAQKFNSASDTAIALGSLDSATPHFTIDADGKLNWGIFDTNLYRDSINVLKTDDSLVVGGNSLVVTGITDVQQIREKLTDSTVSSNEMICDLSTGAIFYNTTSLSSNFTVDIINVPQDNGYAITVTVVINQGATAYYPSAVQIDNVSQTLKWPNGNTLPTPTANKIDIFTFTLLRRSSSWTVLGSYSVNY
jgi:hypothetical protein